jgi:hypothetical protein
MADKTTLEQMLEHLVNDEQAKAEELFHEYVVAKSREVYENLIEEEMKDDEDEEVDEASKDDDADEDKVDEASKDDDAEEDKVDEASDDDAEDKVDEEFEEVAVEADDEDEMDAMGGDATDDLEADITGDDEDGDKEPEELFQDLDSIVDELQAKFDEIKGDDGEEGDEMDMDAEKEEETFAPEASADPEGDAELATMREYVEKVAGGHGAETKGSAEAADNKKSVVDNMKNDMGGTTANILKGGEESGKNDGGLADINAKEENAGNVNTPGSKNATKMSNEKGHGAEKKGAAENADNKQSLFRGRR